VLHEHIGIRIAVYAVTGAILVGNAWLIRSVWRLLWAVARYGLRDNRDYYAHLRWPHTTPLRGTQFVPRSAGTARYISKPAKGVPEGTG